MSAENKEGKIEKSRGGCLDAIVNTVTLGKYGVETIAIYSDEFIKTSNIPLETRAKFTPEKGTLFEIAFRTGELVYVEDFETVNDPTITMKIVKNELLP